MKERAEAVLWVRESWKHGIRVHAWIVMVPCMCHEVCVKAGMKVSAVIKQDEECKMVISS